MTQARTWLSRLTYTSAPGAVLWIRFYVGAIFLSEGILKFVRPAALGIGRFDKVGIPAPAFFAAFDGVFEIGCGLLILAGLLTRVAAVPMVIDMICALAITKLPLLWGHVALFKGESGWWDFAHESRVEVAQLCGSVFLLLVGAGRYSLDARLHHNLTAEATPQPRRN
ncbi:DoxX family protein [Streptomyces sp. NPDC093261]|uniref:DoxX family protein n=1 Tax=Streptomyces sp. NPDC093261 TaxID=3366037 RepID=UPI0038049378